MKTTIKEVFQHENWVLKGITQGYNGRVRIDAKTRRWIPDEINFFSRWCSQEYAESLAKEYYGRKLEEITNFKY